MAPLPSPLTAATFDGDSSPLLPQPRLLMATLPTHLPSAPFDGDLLSGLLVKPEADVAVRAVPEHLEDRVAVHAAWVLLLLLLLTVTMFPHRRQRGAHGRRTVERGERGVGRERG